MDTNDWAALLPEKLQNFSDALQQCKVIEPDHTALAISKIEAIFAEIQDLLTSEAKQKERTSDKDETK